MNKEKQVNFIDPSAKCPLFKFYNQNEYKLHCIEIVTYANQRLAKFRMKNFCDRMLGYTSCPVYSKYFYIKERKITVRPQQDGRTDYIDMICGLKTEAVMVPILKKITI